MDIGTVMMKRAYITGTTLRHRTLQQEAAIAVEIERRLWALIDAGRTRPRVSRVFPLREAAQAHIYLDSSLNVGKTVLTIV